MLSSNKKPYFAIIYQNVSPSLQDPFNKITPFFIEIMKAAKVKGIITYIFTLQDIDWQNKRIYGWYYNNNQLYRQYFPFPQVIYNRISSRKFEKSTETKEAIRRFKQEKIAFFNEHFLNKLEVYYALKVFEPLAKIMPKTTVYRNKYSLIFMLQQFPVIYLKPVAASLGRGIIRITKQNNDVYLLHSNSFQNTEEKIFNSLQELQVYVRNRLKNKQYLIQEGIKIINFNNKPVDFRILVNKNGEGKWQISSMIARSSTVSTIVSNIARGGEIRQINEMLKLFEIEKIKKMKQLLRSTALTIAETLDNSVIGHFAEFGIDLALDENKKIWLLEVNTKPSKNDMPETDKIRISVQNLLNYVLYLIKYPDNYR